MNEIASVVPWDRPPDGLDAIAAELSAMRVAAGSPSFAGIGRAIAQQRAMRGVPPTEQRIARSTLYDCFRSGRRRVDYDAVIEIAVALGLPESSRQQWSKRVAAAQASADGAAVAIVLEQPPPPVPYFSGNEHILGELVSRLSAPVSRVWLTGMAGAGKSQLAFMAARRLEAAGIQSIFLDLRGYHAQSPPVDPVAAQRAILRTLGAVDPENPQDRRRAVLDGLADSGKVLILDDAAHAAHVSELLGTQPNCRVLVTSRVGVAAPAWTVLTAPAMTAADVGDLLGNFASDRAMLTPDAVNRLTAVTGGLPLALSLVAARLKTHPHWTLLEQAEFLDHRLAAAHLDAELAISLQLSYDVLSTAAAALLRQFADLPIADIDAASAAIFNECAPDVAAALIAELVANGLAVNRHGGRIALHSVVRSFAKAHAQEHDPPTTREATFARAATHAAEQVWRAYASISRSMDSEPRPTAFAYPDAPWEPKAATEWLRANLADVLSLAHAAPIRGLPELQWRISEGLSLWMNIAGHVSQALLLHEAAAATAAQLGDVDALAMASLDAGQLLVLLDQPDRALTHFQRAAELAEHSESLSDPGLRGLLLNMSAVAELRYGQLHRARTNLEEAVEIHSVLNEDTRLMSALANLALALQLIGDERAETEACERGLSLARAKDHRMFIANFLVNRSRMHAFAGDVDHALTDALEAVEHARAIGFAYLEATAMGSAADAYRRLGQYSQAAAHVSQALQIARDLGSTLAAAEILVIAAELARDRGELDEARARLAESEKLLVAGRDLIVHGHIWMLRGDLTDDHDERQRWWTRASHAYGESNSARARRTRELLGG